MKALVFKEIRENLKLAALGMGIYTLVLLQQYHGYVMSPRDMTQPLVNREFLMFTAWFCALFGAVLGWLQIHNERRPDLWAFLMHRPMTRTSIFLAKAIAGLGLYAVAAGLPLLGFIVWARLPGHVGAPFEPIMLRPAATFYLAGTVGYFAGMLTGLRQARWYASRALGLGVVIVVIPLMLLRPEFWQGLAILLLGAAILITAAWGGFQNHGHYHGQPALGKAALTGALTLGSLVVVGVAAVFLTKFLPRPEATGPEHSYSMTQTGAVFKVTVGAGRPPEIVDLEGKPLLDAKTGHMIELAEFNRHAPPAISLDVKQGDANRYRSWMERDCSLFSGWRATPDTVWYFWDRYGRLAGYDSASRRFIGSLGPNGFARDIAGQGDLFRKPEGGGQSRTLLTDTTVFLVDVEQRTVKTLLTTTKDDPILGVKLMIFNDYDREYTALVVTKRFIQLLTADVKPMWKIPYEPAYPDYTGIKVQLLEPLGQWAVWITPDQRGREHPNSKLPSRVTWLTRNQGIVRSIDLPALPEPGYKSRAEDNLFGCVMPPGLIAALNWLRQGPWSAEMLPLFLRSFGTAVVLCLPIGWWLGRRYSLPLRAQVGWAVFLLLCGVPGLLAFLSVQEWPAREACPNCKRLRLVDRAQCEHCGADFAPPEKTGTEVFEPLQVV
jgi:hypothetical protein